MVKPGDRLAVRAAEADLDVSCEEPPVLFVEGREVPDVAFGELEIPAHLVYPHCGIALFASCVIHNAPPIELVAVRYCFLLLLIYILNEVKG